MAMVGSVQLHSPTFALVRQCHGVPRTKRRIGRETDLGARAAARRRPHLVGVGLYFDVVDPGDRLNPAGPPEANTTGQPSTVLTHLAHIVRRLRDRRSTRLNSSHVAISYAVFCLKK